MGCTGRQAAGPGPRLLAGYGQDRQQGQSDDQRRFSHLLDSSDGASGASMGSIVNRGRSRSGGSAMAASGCSRCAGTTAIPLAMRSAKRTSALSWPGGTTGKSSAARGTERSGRRDGREMPTVGTGGSSGSVRRGGDDGGGRSGDDGWRWGDTLPNEYGHAQRERGGGDRPCRERRTRAGRTHVHQRTCADEQGRRGLDRSQLPEDRVDLLEQASLGFEHSRAMPALAEVHLETGPADAPAA